MASNLVTIPSSMDDIDSECSETEELNRIVFGEESTFKSSSEQTKDNQDVVTLGYFVDRGNSVLEFPTIRDEDDKNKNALKRKIWSDPSSNDLKVDISKVNRLKKLREHKDEQIISADDYESRLRKQFVILNGTPKWAAKRIKSSSSNPITQSTTSNASNHKNDDDDDEDEDLILASSGSFIKRTDKRKFGIVRIFRKQDANNAETMENGGVQPIPNKPLDCINFHPTKSDLLLTSGRYVGMHLIKLCRKQNTLLKQFDTKKYPPRFCNFVQDGSAILYTTCCSIVKSWNLESSSWDHFKVIGSSEQSWRKFITSPSDPNVVAFIGEGGSIPFVSLKTHRKMHEFRMNGNTKDICFDASGDNLCAVGDDGEVYIFDLKAQRCIRRFKDEGSLVTVSCALSPLDDVLITGSSTGHVNLYDLETVLNGDQQNRPSTLKCLNNLKTPVHSCTFSPTGEFFCFSSKQASDSVKLYDMVNGQVCSNFPINKSNKTSVGRISATAFSPDGTKLVLGNHYGRAIMYQLDMENRRSSHKIISDV